MLILKNIGFPNSKFDVHGASTGETRLELFLFYLAFTSITSNCIIVGCWVSKKQFLTKLSKEMQTSAITKRMQGDLHRVFIALAISPLLVNVFPITFYFLTLGSCESYPISTLFCSIFFVLAPIINSITCLFFVRHFRRLILHYLGLNRLVFIVLRKF